MTHLIASIPVDTLAGLSMHAQRAWQEGATAIELRIDTFDGDSEELHTFLAAQGDRTWIVTCRSMEEGGHFRGDTMERVSMLLSVARGTNAFVDFEWAHWQRSANIRQKIELAAADTLGGEPRLILSTHDFRGCPVDLAARIASIKHAGPDVIAKCAYHSADITESFAALDLIHEYGRSIMSIAMGAHGQWTRVLAKKLGALGTFCSLEEDQPTAPGQCTLHEMTSLYRWGAVDETTKVYGVIGHPVAHSMSPAIFNRWFDMHQVNAIYLPLFVRGDQRTLPHFLEGCRGRPWLDVCGFSITIPHKCAALAWAGECADRRSRRIGAVNTLAFDGTNVNAWNTDSIAAMDSLLAALGASPTELANVPVDVLGTGGAARAVLAGLADLGCRTRVYGRKPDQTKRLASEFGATAGDWNGRGKRTGRVVINCTSIGMSPKEDATPLTTDQLGACELVFDIVYNPLQTRLLKEAKKAGVSTLGGLDMFVRQAALQFEHWTGITPDRDAAASLITQMIGTRQPTARNEG